MFVNQTLLAVATCMLVCACGSESNNFANAPPTTLSPESQLLATSPTDGTHDSETPELALTPEGGADPVGNLDTPPPLVDECEVTPRGEPTGTVALGTVLINLMGHLDGSEALTVGEIDAALSVIQMTGSELGGSSSLIEQAFQLIDLYDDEYGPLFLNEATEGGVPRTRGSDDSIIHYAVIAVQQMILDHAYADNNTARFRSSLEDRAFTTSSYFPGAVNQPAEVGEYSVEIDGSNPLTTHRPFGAMLADSRRPTGVYAPPGNIVEITVPDSMVGADFQIRVGAHSWDLANKNSITRLDRVSLTFPIDCSTTVVANPLGGGIYIEVPYGADVGTAEIKIKNAIRSPFYAARSFAGHTTVAQWEIEKSHAAPWPDLEGDHFMAQVPTAWLSEIEDPATLMADWDASMQSVLDLFGVTETHKTILYVQVDTTLRGSAFFPGYPMSNFPYNPANPAAPNNNQVLLRSPLDVNYVTYHELGHQLLFTKFEGEVEAAVHLPYVRYQNEVFGIDLDTAYSTSSFRNSNVTLDQSFINWAVRPNFKTGLPMRSARPNSEMAYQRRGYGKYITMVKLFGYL